MKLFENDRSIRAGFLNLPIQDIPFPSKFTFDCFHSARLKGLFTDVGNMWAYFQMLFPSSDLITCQENHTRTRFSR